MKLICSFLAGTLLAAPWAATACTCCGTDDWRSVESISSNTYDAEVVSRLELGPGRFRTSGEEDLSISSVMRVGDGFTFRAEMGDFHFRPNALPEHREVDITFITHPQHELVDVADIYHEVIFAGVLQAPASAAKSLGWKTLDVTIVLRGVGNGCFEEDTIRHWLINGSKDPAVLQGSGVLIDKNQTQQAIPADRGERRRSR